MIITCDQCNTRFRLDDAKISRGAAKVRCSKCKHVFVVQQEPLEEQPEVAPVLIDEQRVPEESSSAMDAFGYSTDNEFSDRFDGGDNVMEKAPEAVAAFQVSAETASDAGFAIEYSDAASELAPSSFDSAPQGEEGLGGRSDFDMSTFSATPSEEVGEQPESSFGEGEEHTAPVEYDFGTDELLGDSVRTESTSTEDFAIDFGELASDGDAFASRDADQAGIAGRTEDDPLARSLGFDESHPAGAEVNSSPAGDDTALLFSADALDFGDDTLTASAPAGDEPLVDFAELDFGELETTTAPDARTDEVPTDLAPPIQPQVGAGPGVSSVAPGGLIPEADEETPPLSMSSRRKGSSLVPFSVVGGAIVVIIALAGFGFYFLNGPNSFTKLLAGARGGAEEEGAVSAQKVAARFVKNAEAGELFVVQGEMLNGFKKPRASIQVKVTILGANGQNLITRTAYCGNNITTEQLEELPWSKIEERMNNQFGDSLANLGVQPGKAIPFVVVLNNVPKDAVDYSVQVAGSTVAAQQ